jgi:hypothetical protein
MRSSISRPQLLNRRIVSPRLRWNSTDSSSGHWDRCMPTQGRSRRAASGIHANGSHQVLAPYLDMSRSKLASAKGASSTSAGSILRRRGNET